MEKWKYIFDKRYQISSLGKIRRGTNIYENKKKKFQLLTVKIDKRYGYQYIDLSISEGKIKRFHVHRLVLFAFRGEPKQGQMARHLDDIKLHNSLSNLRWGTKSENHFDFYRNGGVRGFNNPRVMRKALKSRGLKYKR